MKEVATMEVAVVSHRVASRPSQVKICLLLDLSGFQRSAHPARVKVIAVSYEEVLPVVAAAARGSSDDIGVV